MPGYRGRYRNTVEQRGYGGGGGSWPNITLPAGDCNANSRTASNVRVKTAESRVQILQDEVVSLQSEVDRLRALVGGTRAMVKTRSRPQTDVDDLR